MSDRTDALLTEIRELLRASLDAQSGGPGRESHAGSDDSVVDGDPADTTRTQRAPHDAEDGESDADHDQDGSDASRVDSRPSRGVLERVTWPKPRGFAERNAWTTAWLLADPPEHESRHRVVGVVGFGTQTFAIPVVAGHVTRMLRLEGVAESDVDAFVAGRLDDDEVIALYARAEAWLKAAIDQAWASGVSVTLAARGGVLPNLANPRRRHVAEHPDNRARTRPLTRGAQQ